LLDEIAFPRSLTKAQRLPRSVEGRTLPVSSHESWKEPKRYITVYENIDQWPKLSYHSWISRRTIEKFVVAWRRISLRLALQRKKNKNFYSATLENVVNDDLICPKKKGSHSNLKLSSKSDLVHYANQKRTKGLPVYEFKENIVSAVRENAIVIISVKPAVASRLHRSHNT
jgi:hypothetical protein